MTFILWTFAILSFIAYFYAIWMWYMWFVPLLVFLVATIYYISWISIKYTSKELIQKYWLFLAWIVALFGLFGILRFFEISTTNASLFLISINIVFFLISHIFNYKDGKNIGQVWYLFVSLLFLTYMWVNYWFQSFFVSFKMFWSMSLALSAFAIFVLSIFYKVQKNLDYLFVAFLIGIVWLIFQQYISNIYVLLLCFVLFLSIVYLSITFVLTNKPPTDTQAKEVSVRRILAWERVLKFDSKDYQISRYLYHLLVDMPNLMKYFLEALNIFAILLLIYLYFQNALTLKWNIDQIFYWLVMWGFITNVFLLKKIWFTSIVQRLITFIVINFAIYISLFSFFAWDLSKIVWLAILWNIVSSLLVFQIHKTQVWLYLRKVDYLFWVFTTILAFCINIVLLIYTKVAWQLLLPISLLYLGLQWMILYYSIRYIQNIQEVEE